MKFLGIDLGTSNSAVSVFENGAARSILNGRGEINTPSVVRVTTKGIAVGTKAQKYLDSDPDNTFKEFKRIIGTDSQSAPDRYHNQWTAEALSAEVLKALKATAESQEETCFDKVVITVPALFELPQSNATAEAARMAGFKQVEMIPEPVASGLAAGWGEAQSTETWLVYDLGGGTFDVSLLESRDGLLRVVGHDGDNFLGGRDIDRAIVNWLIEQIKNNHQLNFDNQHKDYKAVLRHLEAAAETAKIRLSTTPQTLVELEFEYGDEEFEFDIALSSEQLKSLALPLLQRSVKICKRLLLSQGLPLDKLSRVVLVGGPAHMPVLQSLVAENLAPLASSDADPMSLVSQGAAIYAATINLGCEAGLDNADSKVKHQVWLQFPSVCTELNPSIMGRIIDAELAVKRVQIHDAKRQWKSEKITLDENGLFIAEVPVKPGSKNQFSIFAFDQSGDQITLSYPEINIVHGLTMSDPPLSRSIGLALADGSVKTFIERGTPLPAKRTFVQNTIDTISPKTGQKLEIPILQGERRQSRFCRKVGSMVIDSDDLKTTLHVGASVEITIEVDRGGNLKAHALIADQDLLVEGVAQLVMGKQSIEEITTLAHSLNSRLSAMMQYAFRDRNEENIAIIEPLITNIQGVIGELDKLENDVDAQQRVSRNLMEIDAEIEFIESREQLAELIEECEQSYFTVRGMVDDYGDATDRRILEECTKKMEKAIGQLRQGEIERLIERLDQLYRSAHSKSPEYWKDLFLGWASYLHVATNPKKAQSIVDKGYKCIEKEQYDKLKALTSQLFDLIPNQYKNQGGVGNHDSGIY